MLVLSSDQNALTLSTTPPPSCHSERTVGTFAPSTSGLSTISSHDAERRIPHGSRCSAPTRCVLSPFLVSHFGKARLGSAECATHRVQRPAQVADFREIRATTGEKSISFRIRTYTKRGRGWGSQNSGYISSETLTLPTCLTAASVAFAANGRRESMHNSGRRNALQEGRDSDKL
jgi:hypothetical protein